MRKLKPNHTVSAPNPGIGPGENRRTLFETLPAVLAVEARVGEPLDTDAVTDLDLLVLRVLTDGYDDTDTLAYTSGSSSLGSASEYTRTS